MSSPSNNPHFQFGTSVLTVLALPSVRSTLEAGLVSHMLLQIPILAFAGWHLGVATRCTAGRCFESWDRHGLTGIILAVCIALFWMLPRSIELSLERPGYEFAKFLSVPLAGFALAVSYPRAPVLLRGLLLSHVVSMFGVLAWTFLAAPVRLCLSYLASEQKNAGYLLLAAGFGISAYWGACLLFDGRQAQTLAGLRTPESTSE